MSSKPPATSLLSLLDLFACGLGAAVLLGLVLMVVRVRPPVDRSPSSGLLFRIDVEDPDALFALVLRSPSGAWFEADLRELPLGIASRCGEVDCAVLGFSQEGGTTLRAGTANSARSFIVHLRLEQLPPTVQKASTWEVGVRYFNRDIPDDDWMRWDAERDRAVKPTRLELYRSLQKIPVNHCDSPASIRLGDLATCKVDVSP